MRMEDVKSPQPSNSGGGDLVGYISQLEKRIQTLESELSLVQRQLGSYELNRKRMMKEAVLEVLTGRSVNLNITVDTDTPQTSSFCGLPTNDVPYLGHPAEHLGETKFSRIDLEESKSKAWSSAAEDAGNRQESEVESHQGELEHEATKQGQKSKRVGSDDDDWEAPGEPKKKRKRVRRSTKPQKGQSIDSVEGEAALPISPDADEVNVLSEPDAAADGELMTTKQTRGKRVDPVWDHFVVSNVGMKRPRAVCRYCDKRTTGEPNRLKTHLKKCQPQVLSENPEAGVEECEPGIGPWVGWSGLQKDDYLL